MPTKTFSLADATAVDFIVDPSGTVVDGLDAGTVAALDTILIETGIGSWEMNPNLAGTTVSSVAQCSIGSFTIALIQTWLVNFDRLSNPIPNDAQIKKLTIRRPREVNYTFAASDDFNSLGFGFFSDAGITPIYFSQVFESNFVGTRIINESFAGSGADEVLFDHTAGPTFITKADLILTWSEFNNNFETLVASCQRDSDGNPGTCDLIGSLEFGLGWVVTVEYEDAGFSWELPDPEVDGQAVTVEPGQELVIEGDTLLVDEILTLELEPLDINGDPIGPPVSVPEITWIIVGNNLTFPIPKSPSPTLPITTYRVRFIITSTQFSGTLTLAEKLYLYFYNAPGIYKFVPGQRFDTYYNRPDEGIGDGETFNTAIPKPFAKTGYV